MPRREATMHSCPATAPRETSGRTRRAKPSGRRGARGAAPAAERRLAARLEGARDRGDGGDAVGGAAAGPELDEDPLVRACPGGEEPGAVGGPADAVELAGAAEDRPRLQRRVSRMEEQDRGLTGT